MGKRPFEQNEIDWLWGLILFLAVSLVYLPVWQAGYIWDDETVVTKNPVIVGPLGLKEIWTTSAADICPLTLTTFWFEHKLWGLAPLPYHLINVVLHGCSAILLWRVLHGLRIPGSWWSAALWALHPVQAESVVWITELKNTQSCCFYLLSILFFVRHLADTNEKSAASLSWNYSLSLFFAAMAIASKSSTVILPIVLCLCAWWMRGRLGASSVVKMVPVFLLAISASLLSIWTQNLGPFGHESEPHTWLYRIATVGDAFWFYLGKLIYPQPLVMIYPLWQIDTSQGTAFLGAAATVLAGIFLWLNRQSLRPWAFAFAYFLVALLPVLGFFHMKFFLQSPVADRLQYLASIGPLALVGAGLSRLNPPRLQWLLGASLLFLLGILTWRQARIDGNEVTLSNDILRVNPRSFGGYNDLGLVLLREGHAEESIPYFKTASGIDPTFIPAHENLGWAFLETKRNEQAITEFRLVLVATPMNETIRAGLAQALFQNGQLKEAIAEYHEALEVRPDDSNALNVLGNIYQHQGDLPNAVVEFKKAVALRPDSAPLHYNLGNALTQAQHLDEAIAQYQIALKLDPAYAEAHNQLGIALGEKGNFKDAIDHFKEALRLKPDFFRRKEQPGQGAGPDGTRQNYEMKTSLSQIRIRPFRTAPSRCSSRA